MLQHFGIDRARFNNTGSTDVPTLAECAAKALPERDRSSDDLQNPVNESLRTHIPDYVFNLYWQTARGLEPAEREAYMASLLANATTFEIPAASQDPTQAQVKLQEHGSCFTLFYLEDIVACGCDKPECQNGVKQMFDCLALSECGPVRCAWFDAQTRYASVEMTADEAAHARQRQQSRNAATDSISVCTRTVTADDCLESQPSSPGSCNMDADSMPSLCDLSPQSCSVTSDELLRWATDPMLSDSRSEWSWSHEAQCEYDDAEAPLYMSYTVGERVMLRPSESMLAAQNSAVSSDGPYIIAAVLSDSNYEIRREHEHDSKVVHYSRILGRVSSEGNAPTSGHPGVDPSTTFNVAACQTSDGAVASWLNDAATQFPLNSHDPVIKMEPRTPSPTASPVVKAGRKRALKPTPSLDPRLASLPQKRSRTTVSCTLCARD